MTRPTLIGALVLLISAGMVSAQEDSVDGAPAALTADEIVNRHLTARGGAQRWRKINGLRAVGSCSAFSFKAGCTLIRQRGDMYRLDFDMLQAPAVRARDTSGTWALHKLLWPEPTRLDDSPYRQQIERESVFGPLLLDYADRGLTLEALGAGEIDGIPTLGLVVTFSAGQEETWHFDSETFLEVAVESQVVDFTQASEPVRQRTFYDDFREVDGVVLPHWMEHEFNHRLEGMTVERWEVDPELSTDAFNGPEPGVEEASEAAEATDR